MIEGYHEEQDLRAELAALADELGPRARLELLGESVEPDDLLMAHVYSGYINDRGGQYLRSDFSGTGDAMLHTRRMLGLDAVDSETGRTRLKLIDGTAHVLGAQRLVTHEEAS